MSLSVNLSGKQISWSEITRQVRRVLTETGFDGRWLRLEVTETVMMDDADPTLGVLSDLKKLNVSLDMDDFGIGYSSLRYLHRFPIDALKIDQSFVRDVHKRPESEAIVRTILVLAENMGVAVVAEGVETVKELAFLKEVNCQHVQGNYFSGQLSPDQMTPLIGSHLYDE